MFSVLMSLYEKETPDNLIQCLHSLKIQTLKATEIVIVYDGPINDALRNVVEGFNDELPINVISLPKNMGLGYALNEGLSHCKYNLVARMDTDDICERTRFEKQINYMLENSNIDIMGSAVMEFDSDDNYRLKELPLSHDGIKKFIIKKNPFNHMAVVFKKDKVMGAGGYRHHLYMEDYNLWIRMITTGSETINSQDVLVNVRVGKDMLRKRKGIKYIKSEWELYKLKKEKGLTGRFQGLLIFVMRSILRLLPISLLSIIYNRDRKRRGK